MSGADDAAKDIAMEHFLAFDEMRDPIICGEAAELILSALRKAGHLRTPGTVEVVLDDLEMAVEWMDQTDNPWPGELFSETGVAADIAKDQIKSAIYNHYAALAAGADELAAGAAASSSGTERVR